MESKIRIGKYTFTKKELRKAALKDMKRRREWELYLMMIISVLIFGLFHYLPMYGATIAFKDYNIFEGFFAGEWVGLKHFRRFVQDPYFVRIIRNTILINVYQLVFGFPAPIILALLIYEVNGSAFKRTVQSISYLPHFISTVVIVGILMELFKNQGVANNLLSSIGFKPQAFFLDPRWFRPLYVGSGIWQQVGWGTIVFLATLSAINPELYEAAMADGANRWRQVWHISIPGILPTAILLLILRMGSMLDVGFEKVYLMYNPAIYKTADVISTYVYRFGIENAQFSYSAAVGLFRSGVAAVLLISVNYLSKKVSRISLW
jgi:putative aldouronate transport system permease protein